MTSPGEGECDRSFSSPYPVTKSINSLSFTHGFEDLYITQYFFDCFVFFRGLDPRTGVVIDILYGISPCLLALERKRRTVHKVFMSSSFIRSTRPEVRQIIDKIKEEELSDVVQETQRANLDQITRGRPHQVGGLTLILNVLLHVGLYI